MRSKRLPPNVHSRSRTKPFTSNHLLFKSGCTREFANGRGEWTERGRAVDAAAGGCGYGAAGGYTTTVPTPKTKPCLRCLSSAKNQSNIPQIPHPLCLFSKLST